MTHTFDNDSYSDLHKDTYGFRPSANDYAAWSSATDAEKQVIWDGLCKALQVTIQRDKEDEEQAIERFEKLVTETINNGAKDRSAALRWLMNASTCDNDWEYFCWNYGLPYSYFERK